MDISNHLLTKHEQFALKHGRDRQIIPRYITLHYDAGADLRHTLRYLKNRSLSYHVLIDRDGTLVQGVPFDRQAWHAGLSNFRGIPERLNDHAIGISMANRGPVHKEGNRYWLKNARGNRVGNHLNPNQVVRSKHLHGGRELYWEKYSDAQIDACWALCAALVGNYPTIMDIVGHDEISIDRKIDPGPAFPRDRFYNLVPNRGVGERILYRVVSPDGLLNVRDRPNSSGELIGVLQQDQLVFGRGLAYSRGKKTNWLSISLDERHLHNGFVSLRYLRRVW